MAEDMSENKKQKRKYLRIAMSQDMLDVIEQYSSNTSSLVRTALAEYFENHYGFNFKDQNDEPHYNLEAEDHYRIKELVDSGQYVSARDAAEILGVTYNSIRTYIARGLFDVIRDGSKIYLSIESIESYKKEKRPRKVANSKLKEDLS
ncbi:MAG: helix-turn-helix domain-containing protein [Coriobacteriales bacterium]|nr:helix-turn-helix domain-containing protein [Coriobacteriales bacterium]